MQYQKGLVLSITILFFSGCSTTSPMKVALTELGTSSKSEYGVYGVRYMRSINITGMAPEETVGSLSIDPDKLSIAEQLKRLNLNPKDLPDTITPRLNIGPSVIYERTFCNPESVDAKDKCPTSEDIINIKNVINLQERFIAKLSSAQIKLKVLELVSKAIKNKPAEADKFLNILKLEFQDSKSLNDANPSNYQTKINETEELLKNDIKIIESELDKNKKSINKSGIIVTNWKFESDLSADGGLPGLNGAVSKSKDSFGYAILGNPIIVSLHLGSDIKDWNVFDGEDKNTNFKKLLKEKRLYLTFYQVRAQQISYAESLESTLAAQLELKASELINTIKPFVGGVDLQTLSELQLTISTNYAQYNLSSNQGTLDASIGNLNVRKFSIDQCAKPTECLAGAYYKSVPIINSRVNFIKLRDKFE